MTDGSLFVNADNFNRTMTLVDKELKSSKEESILTTSKENIKGHLQQQLADFPMIDIKVYGLPTSCQEEPAVERIAP